MCHEWRERRPKANEVPRQQLPSPASQADMTPAPDNTLSDYHPGGPTPWLRYPQLHAVEAPDATTGAHSVPVYQNATYAFRSRDELEASRYASLGNPTVGCPEAKLGDLAGVAVAVVCASVMAAISAIRSHLAPCDALLVASPDVCDAMPAFRHENLPPHGATVRRSISPTSRLYPPRRCIDPVQCLAVAGWGQDAAPAALRGWASVYRGLLRAPCQ